MKSNNRYIVYNETSGMKEVYHYDDTNGKITSKLVIKLKDIKDEYRYDLETAKTLQRSVRNYRGRQHKRLMKKYKFTKDYVNDVETYGIGRPFSGRRYIKRDIKIINTKKL